MMLNVFLIFKLGFLTDKKYLNKVKIFSYKTSKESPLLI